jgi:hypothetical protein
MKFCLMRSKHERYVTILSGRHTAVSAVLFNYNTVEDVKTGGLTFSVLGLYPPLFLL